MFSAAARTMSLSRSLLAALLVLALLHPSIAVESFYELTALDATGAEVPLHQYKGKVSLVVNVASHCGYTDLNYKELVRMQEELAPKGFTVLAFPCNQFGEQEPGTTAEILEFAQSYGLNFPLFSKVDVTGDNISSVYSFLFEVTHTRPRWNFSKYLVDRAGAVRQFFSEKGDFSAIRQAVNYLLNKKHTEL